MSTKVIYKRSIDDFDVLANAIHGWRGQVLKLSFGRFAGHAVRVDGTLTSMVKLTSNSVLHARGNNGSVNFSLVTEANCNSLWQGRRLQPGTIVVRGHDVSTDHRTNRGSTLINMAIPVNILARCSQSIMGDEVAICRRSTWTTLSPSPATFQRFASLVSQFLCLGSSSPNWMSTVEAIELEREVVTQLIDMMTSEAGKLTSPKSNALVIQAEEWMRSHLQEAVCVADMCSTLDVNERTVRMAFQHRYGMGPMDFLSVLRLTEVRRELLVSSSVANNVKTVASNWGFSHMGNFSAKYKRQFGELPSITLLRDA